MEKPTFEELFEKIDEEKEAQYIADYYEECDKKLK
jgi:hypothetical protein